MDVSTDLMAMAQAYNNTKVAIDFQGATAKKALDIQKQAGNDMLQLIQSAQVSAPGSVNIRV